VLSVAALASDNLVSLICVWLRRARARRVETCRAPRADTFCYEKVGQICNLSSRCYFSYAQVTNYCDAVHRLCRTRLFAFHRNPEFHHQNIQSGSEPTKCSAGNVVLYADFAVAKECLPHMELLKPVFSQSTSSFSFVITGVAYAPLAHPQPLKMDGGRANGDELHRRNLPYIFRGIIHASILAPQHMKICLLPSPFGRGAGGEGLFSEEVKMNRALRLAATLFAFLLFAFSASLIITKYVWAAPNLQTDDIPLYSKLSWSETGAEDRSFTLDQGGSYFRLPGIGFQSKGISTKPSADIIEFYSQKNLGSLGWGLVNSEAGGLIIVQTYFKHPNMYLVVKMGGCRIAFSQQQLGPGSAPEFCVSVWHSSFAGTVPIPEIQPQPPSPLSAKPATVNYSNPLPVPTFSQNDSSWKNDRQGWPDAGYPTACDFCTLGGYGCWTTSYSMLYNYYSSNNTNPHNLNSNLNSGPNGGPRYASNGAHCNNLMPGGSPYAPSGVSRIDGVPGIYNACASSNCIDSDKVALIQDEINAGRPVLVFVHYSGTSPQHMVVITGYSGSNTWYINDPWDGGRRTLASGALGAYVVDYIMRWNGTPPGGGSGGPPSGYTFCANEGQRCNFSGTKDVAYGANGSFYYKYNITGGIDCNNSVFGDPAYGVSKACYTKDSSQPPPPPPGQWHVEYFSDKNLGSRCYDGYENSVYVFKKWDGTSPASGCPSDGFSARFTRTVNFQGGTYSFHLEHDDGARLFVDGQNLINAWWDGGGGHDGAKDLSGNHEVKIEYYENTGGAYIEAWWRGAGALPNDPANDLYQWRGDYYGNRDLSFRPPMTLNEGNGSLDKNWGSGSPGYGMPSDNFSVRWNRIAAFECGRYRFNVHADDGVRLWVNNQQLLNEWRDQVADFYPEADLPAGNLPIKVEYYESGGGAAIQVNWQKLSSCVTPPSAPTPITPPNGANNPYNYDLTFQWNAVSGASEYLIEWWGGPYSTMQPCGWSSNTSCHIGQVIPGNTYSWHVKARNSAGESGWSGTWTFTLQAKPPAANFDAWPQSGNAPLTVAMHIVDTSNLTSCSWDYGDGQTGTSCASNHEHTYTKAGTYTVRLDVSGPGGSDSMTRNNYIAVSSPPTDRWHVEFFNSFTPGSNRCFDGSNYGTYLFYYWRSEPPNQACSADNFSARFSKRVNFAGGAYQFHIDHDDGGRLYLDGSLIIDNWSYGSNDVTRNVTAGLHDVLYEVNDTGGLAKAVVWWRGPGALPENIRDNSKWWAQYWGNQWFEDQPPLEQNEATIDHDWNLDGPGLGVPSDNFSSRYTKTITFACGHYQFLVSSDDGYRLKLDGNIIGEKWIDGVWWGQAHQADITAGVHEIVLEHYEKDGAAAIHLSWTNVTPCAAPPGAFNKSSPANGTAGQPTNPTLVWGSSSGAANYEYCLDTTDNNTCDSAWTNIGNTTSKTLSGLNNGTQYYWQVRARNTAGTTDANAGAWWSFTTQTQTTNANLLKNPGFELDADTNTIPDNWGANTKFRRVGKPHIEGSYAGRLSATDDKAVTITQKILNLTAGTTYAASCQVNIPATTDAFTFKVQIRWYNSLNRAIRTDVIERTFTGKTNGWEKVTRDIVAPAGTASAQFQFVATSLNAKINVDDCSFTQK
jgi:PKD repeat protein